MRKFRTTLGEAWDLWGIPVLDHEDADVVVDVYDDGTVCPAGDATCYPGDRDYGARFEADARELGAEIEETEGLDY